jgi:hypothetical protein
MSRAVITMLTALALALAVTHQEAQASPAIRYGIQDDAWLAYGPGTLDSRLDTLDRLGVKLVRYSIFWDQIATARPAQPRWSGDPAYQWGAADAVLKGLHARGIAVVVDVRFAPKWANGGNKPNYLPEDGADYANFVLAVQNRFPWIRDWLIWNEPNKAPFMQPVDPKLYVQKLLNPAYAALHSVNKSVRVAGGVTGPRAGANGMSPITFLRGMRAAGAKLDAYAHNPYPGRPQSETPWGPKCVNCQTITMADLERLEREVARAFGHKPIWLTEYGYQTNPPDVYLGVSPQKQATYVSSAAMRVFKAPSVAMLIFFMVRDDPDPAGWQSGFLTEDGTKKPSYAAFRYPLVQTSRRGGHLGLWGQVRSGPGKQPYRVRLEEEEDASWIGGMRWTDDNGFFSITVNAPPGARVRIWSPRDAVYGYELIVR